MNDRESLAVPSTRSADSHSDGDASSLVPYAASHPRGDACGFSITNRSSGKPLECVRYSHHRWRDVSAHLVRFISPATCDFRFDGKFSTVVLLDLHRTDGMARINGRARPPAKNARERLTFVPRACAFSGWSKLAQPSGFFAVRFLKEYENDNQRGLAELPCRQDFEDDGLRMVMGRLRAALQDPSLDHPGYIHPLCDLLSFELQRALAVQPDPARKRGGLTARQVRIVTDHMEAHLSERITIADLAALVGLTRFHFIRSFKESVGLPPHQFMIRKRVDRAKEILSQSSMTIGEVADRTGFRGSLQFARSFRRHVGMTPARFRRERCD
jgi:AraC family transcriptional regulator